MNTLGLTPMLATSAFAVGYCLGWMAMKSMADGSLPRWWRSRRGSRRQAR